jgi:hypothetical protein
MRPGHLHQARDECRARRTRAGMTAPKRKIAIRSERATDCCEIFGFVLQCLAGPIACRKIHSAWGTVSDDVHGIEVMCAIECQSHLPRCRHRAVEHSRLYSRPQVTENRLDGIDGWIDEKDFGDLRSQGSGSTFSRALYRIDPTSLSRILSRGAAQRR